VHIYSDNSTNVVGAEKILREAIQTWNHRKVEEFFHHREILWCFNPPTPSHMGSAWECMVRSVHRILTFPSGERTLIDDQLHTLLLEAEAILNSRPLTQVTFDVNGKTPLTPNHLVISESKYDDDASTWPVQSGIATL